jgi:hypothetical protein
MSTEKNSRAGAIAAVLFAVVVWGASFIATKIAVSEVAPVTVVWLRFGMGVAVLGAVVLARPTSSGTTHRLHPGRRPGDPPGRVDGEPPADTHPRPAALTPGPSPIRTPRPPGEGSVKPFSPPPLPRRSFRWECRLPAGIEAETNGANVERHHTPLSRGCGRAAGRGVGGEGRRPRTPDEALNVSDERHIDLDESLDDLDENLGELDERLDDLDERLVESNERLDELDETLIDLDERLVHLMGGSTSTMRGSSTWTRGSSTSMRGSTSTTRRSTSSSRGSLTWMRGSTSSSRG